MATHDLATAVETLTHAPQQHREHTSDSGQRSAWHELLDLAVSVLPALGVSSPPTRDARVAHGPGLSIDL